MGNANTSGRRKERQRRKTGNGPNFHVDDLGIHPGSSALPPRGMAIFVAIFGHRAISGSCGRSIRHLPNVEG
jgi:hypothetical protein